MFACRDGHEDSWYRPWKIRCGVFAWVESLNATKEEPSGLCQEVQVMVEV